MLEQGLTALSGFKALQALLEKWFDYVWSIEKR
jgi:hypothetical protein